MHIAVRLLAEAPSIIPSSADTELSCSYCR